MIYDYMGEDEPDGYTRRQLLGTAAKVGGGAIAGWWLREQPLAVSGYHLIADPITKGYAVEVTEEYLKAARNTREYLQLDSPSVQWLADGGEIVMPDSVSYREHPVLRHPDIVPRDFTYTRDRDQFDQVERYLEADEYLPPVSGEEEDREFILDPAGVEWSSQSGRSTELDESEYGRWPDLTGDCEDYAIAMGAGLTAMGYDTRFVSGLVLEQSEPADEGVDRSNGHAVVETHIDGTYYIMDVDRPLQLFTRTAYKDLIDAEFHAGLMFGFDTGPASYKSNWAE